MKKFRAMALLLAALMLMTALTGCLGKSDEELMVGRWDTAADVSNLVKEHVLDFDGDFAAADFAGLTLTCRLELRDDGTYTANVAEDGMEGLKQALVARLVPLLKDRIRAELAKAQKVEPEAITDEQLEGYVGMVGMGTWEEMCGIFVDMMGLDTLFVTDGFAGRYLLREGRLCLSGSDDAEVGGDSWSAAYRVSGTELTLEDGDDSVLPDFAGKFPMAFTRAAEGGEE